MLRMKIDVDDRLDMLQVHWQDYSSKAYLDVFRHLADIRREGDTQYGKMKIGAVGLVNFDSARVAEICERVGPNEIASNQIQVSPIDSRP